MSANSPRDIDPTRVLDDFVQRQARADDDAMPDLSGLSERLHPERAAAPGTRGGKLKDGTVWNADDVVDVPIVEVPASTTAPAEMPTLELPMVDPAGEQAEASHLPPIDLPDTTPPAPVDLGEVADTTQHLGEFAAAQWLADARAAAVPPMQPDARRLTGRRVRSPRLRDAWAPGTWIATSALALEATTEIVSTPGGPVIETYPAQRLVALWDTTRADALHLGRWPRRAFLCAADDEDLDDAVLAQVPDEAGLWWLPGGEALVDWALVAEIVLLHENRLRPFQAEALKALIARQREAAFALMNDRYHRPEGDAAVQRRP